MLTRLKSLTRHQAAVSAAGVVGLGALFGILHESSDLRAYVVETIGVALAAGIVYLVVLYLLERAPERRDVLWIVVAGGILFRLQLFPLAPAFSDDLYRYHWEGRIQAAGWNPYTVRPDDPRLAALRDAHWARTSGRDLPTVYPPLVELVFRATYRLIPQAPGMGSVILSKLPFLLADLAVIFLLAGWVRATGGRNFQVAIYAWNPLVVFEFAASGHNDALALAALVAASFAIIRGRAVVSTLLLTAGALAKWFPLVLVPLWLRRAGWPLAIRGWVCALAGVAFAAACAWPYRTAWPGILETLASFESRWQNNNASLWALLEWFSGSRDVATGMGVGVVAGLALWVAGRRLEPVRAAYLLVGAILLLSQNAFSWYFTWIVPLLSLDPSPKSRAAWLMLSVLQFLSYHVLLGYHATGEWRFEPVMLWLTYAPFYALLLWARLNPQRDRDEHR